MDKKKCLELCIKINQQILDDFESLKRAHNYKNSYENLDDLMELNDEFQVAQNKIIKSKTKLIIDENTQLNFLLKKLNTELNTPNTVKEDFTDLLDGELIETEDK